MRQRRTDNNDLKENVKNVLELLMRDAKKEPQFISLNNDLNSVILDYDQYQDMRMELETLRELTIKLEAIASSVQQKSK